VRGTLVEGVPQGFPGGTMMIVRTADRLRSTANPLLRNRGAMRSTRLPRACAVMGQDRVLRMSSAVRWLSSVSSWVGVPSQPSGWTVVTKSRIATAILWASNAASETRRRLSR